jgi:4-amino-4-deoxy-L-arabinose transferase-like glycosyltransferase
MAIPVLLFGIAFLARALIAGLFLEPAYPDAFYYANVAHQLAAGHGFSVDYIWNFVEVGGRLPDVGVLPIPSNAHWMPLAVLVQVPFIWVLGETPLASALPFWLAAAATAPLTYVIGRDAGMARWQAVLAGLLVAMPGALAPYLGQPDNFALFMLLGALALWLCARGVRGDRRSFALGGLVVGLAFLSRNDGVLLGVPYALAFLGDLVHRPRRSRIGWWPALACAAGFLLVAAPWLLRQQEVFGSLSPSSVGGRILFIREYRELYSVTSETTLSSFLAQGPLSLVGSRVEGLLAALRAFGAMPLLILLVPALLVGLWRRRRDQAFGPWLVYAVVLFAFSALVSAVHVPYGTFIHSAVALVPHAYLLSMVGIAAIVGWVAARRPSWDAATATRNLSVMVVLVVLVVSSVATVMTVRTWQREQAARQGILAALAQQASIGDVVMSPDAGAYRYHGGWPGIVTPDDPLPVVEETLRRYGARWLVLERDHLTAGLRPILAGEERPAWLSAPIASVPGQTSADGETETSPDDALPAAALYAVCLEAGDDRCRS